MRRSPPSGMRTLSRQARRTSKDPARGAQPVRRGAQAFRVSESHPGEAAAWTVTARPGRRAGLGIPAGRAGLGRPDRSTAPGASESIRRLSDSEPPSATLPVRWARTDLKFPSPSQVSESGRSSHAHRRARAAGPIVPKTRDRGGGAAAAARCLGAADTCGCRRDQRGERLRDVAAPDPVDRTIERGRQGSFGPQMLESDAGPSAGPLRRSNGVWESSGPANPTSSC
jgi:hypothetical protein